MHRYTYWFCDSNGDFRTLEGMSGNYQLVKRANRIEVWVLGVPEPDGSREVLGEYDLHYGLVGDFRAVAPKAPEGSRLTAITL